MMLRTIKCTYCTQHKNDNIVVFNKEELENNWHHENEDAFIALNIFMNVRNNVVVL